MLELEEESQMVKVRMSEMTRVDIQKALDGGFGTVVFAVAQMNNMGLICLPVRIR